MAGLGAVFYWANNVQGVDWPDQQERFEDSLAGFVTGGFDRAASVVDGADFTAGTGGVVNNGAWTATPHENAKRLENFDFIISEFVNSLSFSIFQKSIN